MTISNNIREKILKVVFVLVAFSLMENGVRGQCSIGLPINLAVYEGTQNFSMMCNSPKKISWTFRPSTSEKETFKITNFDDFVNPNYTKLFAVGSSGLIIKIGQGLASVSSQSTAALYSMSLNGSSIMFGAKLVIVRNVPTCECTRISSTNINITCSISYADMSYNPISAQMNWTANGNFFRNDIPARRLSGGYWTSTSTIIVDAYKPSTYECTVTFTKPTSITYTFVATNAPVFSASCTSPCMIATVPTPTFPIPTTTIASSQSTTGPSGSGTERSGGGTGGGLSDGGKIGIGVAIGVGVTLLFVGILFAIFCRRYEWTKRTKKEASVADEKRTNGLEEDNERTQKENPNTPPYQPLSVLSTPTPNVEATGELYETIT